MDDRERIWKLLFGDKPMPKQTNDAVDKAFGMLSDLFEDISEEEFDEILREAKGKDIYVRTDEEE